MPTSLEHILIYAIVLLVLAYLVRRWVCSMRRGGKCSRNCLCGKGEIQRDPVIANYLKKKEKD